MKTLKIYNFKCFKHLELKNPGRLNLVTGRNSCGKTSLLEAIAIYLSGIYDSVIIDILFERGEIRKKDIQGRSHQDVKDIFSSFFYGRKSDFSEKDSIRIISDNTEMSLRFVYFFYDEKINKTSEGETKILQKKIISEQDLTKYSNEVLQGLEYSSGDKYEIIPLQSFLKKPHSNGNIKNKFIFYNKDTEDLARLWDKIILTDKEKIILEGLRIIEPQIEKLAFIESEQNSEGRYPVVRVSGDSRKIPLQSMGEGLNRILSILLNIAGIESGPQEAGVLLIDEFENGLHYSIQKKLWEILFRIASEFNIQLFVTTHSNDTIKAFAEAMISNPQTDGRLYRLDNKLKKIVPFEFAREEIIEAAYGSINLR